MFKNIQIKIILVFFLIGIVIISGLGIVFLNSLNNLNMQIENGQVTQVNQMITQINDVSLNTKITLGVSALVFAIVAIIIAIFLSKFVIYPINRLIQSAEKMTEEDSKNNKEHKRFGNRKKRRCRKPRKCIWNNDNRAKRKVK